MKRLLIFAALLVIAAAPALHGGSIDRNNRLLEFQYQWSREAAAVPALDRRLRAAAEASYAQGMGAAREVQASARKEKRPFQRHEFALNWETLGQTPRLLSLGASIYSYAGGAHPNHQSDGILWDRHFNKQLPVAALFTRPSDFVRLTRARYCKALDEERRARRSGELIAGEFRDCPEYKDLSILPRARNPKRRFETILFDAEDYVAGPYVEGQYAIEVPVTGQLIAALKPQYRSSFEVQRQ
jgi:hypothetical protein